MSADDFREKKCVRINYDEFATTDDKFVHEGQYVPDDVLPFTIENCAGTRFDLCGTECLLLGDLGGHAVYKYQRDRSTIRTMDWSSFAQEIHRNNITIT